MKAKIHIPRIAVLLGIIALLGLGAQLVKYTLSVITENQLSEVVQRIKSLPSISFQPASLLSNYEVITKNDLFKPLGWRETVTTVPPPPQPPIQKEVQQELPEPLNELALTGIVRLGSEYVALVEDHSKGEDYFLRKGDNLKDYFVELITEESIALNNGNSRLTLTIGSVAHYDSRGLISASEPRDNQMTVGFVKNKAEEPVQLNENSADLSLIEQMKARRKKELEQE